MKFDSKELKFKNEYEEIGHEFGDLHAKRDEFIRENAGKYRPEPLIPTNIEGLTKLNGQGYPSTRRWFRRTSSFERNGFMNWHTHTFNVKWVYWSFYLFVVWGCLQPVLQFRHNEIYHNNFEEGGSMYDKMLHRTLPGYKIWNRPS